MEVKQVRLVGELVNEEALLDAIASRRIENNCFVVNLDALVLIGEGDDEVCCYWDVISAVDRTALRVPMPDPQWREAVVLTIRDGQDIYARYVVEVIKPERIWETRLFRFSRVGDRVFIADITPRVEEVPEIPSVKGGNGNGAIREVPVSFVR